MHQVGFDDFEANTLGDWILVLFIGAVFTAFIVALCVAILSLYNVLSQRTGMGLRVVTELPPSEERVAIETPLPEASTPPAEKPAAAAKRKVASKRSSPTKSS